MKKGPGQSKVFFGYIVSIAIIIGINFFIIETNLASKHSQSEYYIALLNDTSDLKNNISSLTGWQTVLFQTYDKKIEYLAKRKVQATFDEISKLQTKLKKNQLERYQSELKQLNLDLTRFKQKVFEYNQKNLKSRVDEELELAFRSDYQLILQYLEKFETNMVQHAMELNKENFFQVSIFLTIEIIFLMIASVLLFISINKRHLAEAKFRSLVESSSDWIWEIDSNHRYIYSSPQAQSILGYTQEDILKKTPFDFIVSEEMSKIRRIYDQHTESGNAIVTLENTNLHLDGRQVVLETSALPIFDSGKNVVGYRGISRNITARKQTEKKLRNLRKYLSNIIDSMPSILVGVDNLGNVTQWNQTTQQATGIPSKEAVGKKLEDVYPLLASEMGKIFESIRTREVKQDSKRKRKSDSTVYYDTITIYPLVANGAIGAVIRIDDITEKVRLEEMMIQSEKMLSIGGLAAGMAHEINNPLAGMIQTASVLSQRLTGDVRTNITAAEKAGVSLEGIKKYMDSRDIPTMLLNLQQAGIRVSEIVTNMLSFARKSGSIVTQHSLTHLLDQSAELCSTDYDLKKNYDFRQIEITKEYQENLPHVYCDGGKIQQVFMNILRNGAEAMQEVPNQQSRFIFRAMQLPDDDMVQIEIEDNGLGMDETTRKRIFEPFFTTKAPDKGTGLGLSVSYFIIADNHRGEMTVKSTPPHGTTFIIRLPIEQQ